MAAGQVGRDSEVSKKRFRSNPTSAADDSSELEFELIRNDLPLRWLRKVGIVPANGLCTGRRAILMTLLCRVPLMLWAFLGDRLSSWPRFIQQWGWRGDQGARSKTRTSASWPSVSARLDSSASRAASPFSNFWPLTARLPRTRCT